MCSYNFGEIMRSLESSEIKHVRGGGVLSLSIGLLLGALAARGYDFYLETTDKSSTEPEEDASSPAK